jgi:hypothetical protein
MQSMVQTVFPVRLNVSTVWKKSLLHCRFFVKPKEHGLKSGTGKNMPAS